MKSLGITAFVALIIALIIFAPFALIWALNTLFALSIPYTFWTWLASLVITSIFGKSTVKVNKG